MEDKNEDNELACVNRNPVSVGVECLFCFYQKPVVTVEQHNSRHWWPYEHGWCHSCTPSQLISLYYHDIIVSITNVQARLCFVYTVPAEFIVKV